MTKPANTTDRQPWKDTWGPLLVSSLATLRRLAGTTEQDFLRIGVQMQNTYQHTVEWSHTAEQLVETAGGVRIGELMKKLRCMLSDMADSLDQAQQRSAANLGRIVRVGTILKQVSQPVEEFRRMAKQLYIFEVLIRIESTYLKEMEAEFVNLATDIHSLSTQIKERTSFIKNNIDSLATTVVHNSRFFEQEIMLGEQKKSTAITNTGQSLTFLEQIHQSYLQAGAVIEAVSTKNSEDISEIVQSMQIHDTYRQQVDHVVEAIDGLFSIPGCAEIAPASTGLMSPLSKEALLKIGDVCEIQHAQLKFAGTALSKAVETIIARLRDMRESQRKVTAEISSESGDGRRNHSFLGDITAHMLSVTSLLREYGTTTATMEEMMHNVLRTMGEISTFVNDVERFGHETIQIALNARIKAVATGQDGAAMSALSDEVGRLSKDAIQRTDIISQSLGEIRIITEELGGETDSGQTACVDQFAAMQNELEQILGALEQVGNELRTLSERMRGQGASLTGEIDHITQGIDVHTRIQQISAEVLGNLSQVFTAARVLCPAGEAFKEEMHSLAARYTMESERRIHAVIAGKRGHEIGEPARPATAAPLKATGEFGDNVDLF